MLTTYLRNTLTTSQVLLRNTPILVQQMDVLSRPFRLPLAVPCDDRAHVGAVLASRLVAVHNAETLQARQEPRSPGLHVSMRSQK